MRGKRLLPFIAIAGTALVMVSGCATLPERLVNKLDIIIPKNEAAPGEVVQVTFVLPNKVGKGWVTFLNRKFKMVARPDMDGRAYTAFLPVPTKVQPGQYIINSFFPYIIDSKLKTKGRLSEKVTVQILPNYVKEKTHSVRLRRFKESVLEEDRKTIRPYLAKSTYKPEQLPKIMLPMGGSVVSTFGTVRTYNKKSTIPLKGLEIVPVSRGTTDVRSAAPGEVKFVRKLPMLGRIVLIDHGWTFMTLYCHLGKTLVKEGQLVDRGETIGQVGRSGKAAVDRRLYYQLYVAGVAINLERYSNIEIFE